VLAEYDLIFKNCLQADVSHVLLITGNAVQFAWTPSHVSAS